MFGASDHGGGSAAPGTRPDAVRVPEPRGTDLPRHAAPSTGGVATVRVSLIEDEVLLRRMLERLLRGVPGLAVVHSVGGFAEAQLVVAPASTDVLVVDVNLGDGDGLVLAHGLQRRDPRLGVLVLSSEDVLGAFAQLQDEVSKPWSYLSKRSSFAVSTLTRAVLAASRGEPVVDPYLVDGSRPRADSTVGRLTPTQFRVLSLVAQGHSNDSVAATMSIGVRSVENHLLAIYRILGVATEGRNRRVLATLAFIEQTSRHRVR